MLDEQRLLLVDGKAMATQSSPSSLGCNRSGMRASLTFALGNLKGFWQSTNVTYGTTRCSFVWGRQMRENPGQRSQERHVGLTSCVSITWVRSSR